MLGPLIKKITSGSRSLAMAQTVRQTDRRTWRLYDRPPGQEGQVGENILEFSHFQDELKVKFS